MFRSCQIIIRELCSLLKLYYSIHNSIRICKRGVVAAYHVVWECVVAAAVARCASYDARRQPNLVHIPTSHLLEIHPNIIHSSTSRSPQWSLSLRFPHQDPIQPPLLLKHSVKLRNYTGCPRRNVPDFGRVFLMLKYTDITQNTYIQS